MAGEAILSDLIDDGRTEHRHAHKETGALVSSPPEQVSAE